LIINMNSRIFAPSIRPLKAPRHEAGSTPRHLIPCRYFARGYCSRGDSCMFSHSLHNQTQLQSFSGFASSSSTLHNTYRSLGLQGNQHPTTLFRNNCPTFSPHPYAKYHPETRRSLLSPRPIIVPPPSPSSSSVTTPDEVSPLFNFRVPEGSSRTPSIIVADIMSTNSTLTIQTHPSVTGSEGGSCDEFSSLSTGAHLPESHSPSSHSDYLAPGLYVQRSFEHRDSRVRGANNRRRRARVKLISATKASQERETCISPSPAFLRATTHCKSGTTSDSDSASMRPHQETWRVIGGGVMLGTATNVTSRRKLKRLQSCVRMTAEGRLDGPDDESCDRNPSTDEIPEFADLIESVKLTINQPPSPDIIERPKSSLPPTKGSPLAAFFAHAEVA